jgi:hypothetical protein
MIEKGFDEITKDDIDALVTNGVCEDRGIDYKLQLPRERLDEDSKEFLADVSSFANAGGGDLIYGIREARDASGKPNGTPEAAEGLASCNPDAVSLRLSSMILDGTAPRIPGFRIKPINGFPLGPVVVLRVPKSWASPHMVKFGKSSRFYSRTSAGKYALDVQEIRAAFLASASIGEKISGFRSDRVGKILAGETPVPLEAAPKIVIHLLPIRAFSEPVAADLKAAESEWRGHENQPKPMGQPRRYGPPQFNFSGLYCPGMSEASSTGYVQLFRSGALEAVCSNIARAKLVIGGTFEKELMSAARLYIEFQNRLGFGPPLFVAISLLSAKGFTIFPTEPANPESCGQQSSRIDQDALLAPEVQVEGIGLEIERLLRPALDTLWQASGWPGSPGYDQRGKWVGCPRPSAVWS